MWRYRQQAVPGGIEDHFCLVAEFREVQDEQYRCLRPDPEARFHYGQELEKVAFLALKNQGLKSQIQGGATPVSKNRPGLQR